MNTTEIEHYLALAREAAKNAYCPYSGFRVGCVLLGQDGEIFKGCNIESCAYAPSICAERTAAASAIVQGVSAWKAVFVVSPTRVSPCGVCRQFLYEFAPGLHVYVGYLDASIESGTSSDTTSRSFLGPISLADLLPGSDSLQHSALGHKR